MSGLGWNRRASDGRTNAGRRVARLTWLALVAVGLWAFAGTPRAAASTNFSWSGGGQQDLWTLVNNWSGGVSPTGSVGTLSFLDLGSACAPTTSPQRASDASSL